MGNQFLRFQLKNFKSYFWILAICTGEVF
jgi:hypothetical protein